MSQADQEAGGKRQEAGGRRQEAGGGEPQGQAAKEGEGGECLWEHPEGRKEAAKEGEEGCGPGVAARFRDLPGDGVAD